MKIKSIITYVAWIFILLLVPIVSADLNYTTLNSVFSNFSVCYNSEGFFRNISNTIIGNINSTIDDVMIFNRSLSSDEILSIYNATKYQHTENLSDGSHTFKAYTQDLAGNMNNSGVISYNVDTTLPNATLLTPLNNTFNSTLTQNFTFNLSDNLGIRNATLTIYNQTGFYNSTIFNYVVGTLSATSSYVKTLLEGWYTWFVELFDWGGNSATTGNYTITIDTTFPTWNNNKTDLTSSTILGTNVYFNITLSDINPSAYIFSWYNGTNWENTTNSYTNGQQIKVNKTINIDIGNINWTWYINDSANNLNQTTIWSINLVADDAIPPNVTINSPLNISYNTNSINFNITAIDNVEMSSCWMTLNNGINNYTMTNLTLNIYNHTNTSIGQGSYTARFYCNDTNNNVNNSESVSFTIDWGGSFGEIYWEKDSFLVLNYSDSDYTSFNNTDTSNQVVYIYNLTDALIYNGTNLINSSTNIFSNDGNINISLRPNETVYVLNRFNLTESISRENSPLWVSSSITYGLTQDTRTYYLASNLTNTINFTFYSAQPCPNLVTYSSASGIYTNVSYACLNLVQVNISGLEKSNNILTFIYNRNAQSGGGAEGITTEIETKAPEIYYTSPKEQPIFSMFGINEFLMSKGLTQLDAYILDVFFLGILICGLFLIFEGRVLRKVKDKE